MSKVRWYDTLWWHIEDKVYWIANAIAYGICLALVGRITWKVILWSWK